MRLTHAAAVLPLALLAASSVRAEYIVLRSGQRLHVGGYQILGDKYRLQLDGGFVDVPVDEVASIEPEDTFTPSPVPEAAKAPFRELIQAAAERYSVDAELVTSVIAAESNFDPKAVSRRNARGLMQLLPETAARFGVQNIFDPKENIEAGTRYLSELLQRYKNDLALALAAYNAGPERVQQYGNVPPYRETRLYVRRVKKTYDERKATPANGKTAARVRTVPAPTVAPAS
jgi:soluble lytic murein transglycosylase-like protein